MLDQRAYNAAASLRPFSFLLLLTFLFPTPNNIVVVVVVLVVVLVVVVVGKCLMVYFQLLL